MPYLLLMLFCALTHATLSSPASQSLPGREEVIAFFLQGTNAMANPSTPTPDPLPPMLEALEQSASKKPDEALVAALLRYQQAHPGAEDPRVALALGRLYWSQPKAFLAAFRSLDPPSQRRLIPYVEFGWKQCIRGKIKTGRHFQQLQQDLDRLSASMINAR